MQQLLGTNAHAEQHCVIDGYTAVVKVLLQDPDPCSVISCSQVVVQLKTRCSNCTVFEKLGAPYSEHLHNIPVGADAHRTTLSALILSPSILNYECRDCQQKTLNRTTHFVRLPDKLVLGISRKSLRSRSNREVHVEDDLKLTQIDGTTVIYRLKLVGFHSPSCSTAPGTEKHSTGDTGHYYSLLNIEPGINVVFNDAKREPDEPDYTSERANRTVIAVYSAVARYPLSPLSSPTQNMCVGEDLG
jgi:hypothetical protein